MINSLRMSVTQRCNLSCPYCHNEGQLSSKHEMSYSKIKEILSSARSVGISQLKLTGGEPLLRDDILDIVKYAKEVGFEDISMVTNGILLPRYASLLREAGLGRVNIGCDSINPSFLSGKGGVDKAIKSAQEAGLKPIKINMVVLKGITDMLIDEMILFAKTRGVVLQLVELIRVDAKFYEKHFFSLENVERELGEKAVDILTRPLHNRKQYDLGDVLVEIVRPFHDGFCENCTRLRVTANGKIKTCILENKGLVPFHGRESLLASIRLKEGQP